MTTGELLELAAIITAKAPLLIGNGALSADALAQYWSASKCRQQRWAQSLKQTSEAAGRCAPKRLAIGSLLDEIFAGEVLTRVFAAIAVLHDRRHQTSDAEPIVRSVLMGHLESRRRALTLLAGGLPVSSHDGVEINRRRCRAERWNDLLIGCLQSQGDVIEFAVEPETAAEFADDFRDHGWHASGIAWTLVMASLRAEARDAPVTSGNHDLHQQIGAAVLGCFGHDSFDSLGLPRSLWTARLLHAADNAQGLVEQLFAVDRPAALPKTGFIVVDRHRRAR